MENERRKEMKIRERVMYMIVAQRLIQEGHAYRLCVQTKSTSAPVLVLVKILMNEDRCLQKKSFILNGDDLKFVEFDFSDIVLSDTTYKIEIDFLEPESNKLITQQQACIGFKPVHHVCLIQLDKPLYRPGESVRFRVLLLDNPKLTPCVDQPISVLVKDPKGNLIKSFKSNRLTTGIGQYEYQLSDQPPLGDWTVLIDLDENKCKSYKQFKVMEYVLPTFEARVEMKKEFSLECGIIKGNVIADYTFGKPVTGNADICITCQYLPTYVNDMDDSFKFSVKINQGIANFELNLIDKLKLTNAIRKIACLDCVLEAVVTDTISEQQVKCQVEFRLIGSLIKSKYDVKILDKYRSTYIPGLKHRILLSLTNCDGLPISGSDPIILGVKYSSKHKFIDAKLYPSTDGLVECEIATLENYDQIVFRAKFRKELFNLGLATGIHTNHGFDRVIRLQLLNGEINTRQLTGQVGKSLLLSLSSSQKLDQVQVYVINSNLNTVLHIANLDAGCQKQITFKLNPTEQWRPEINVIAMLVFKVGPMQNYRQVYDQLSIRIVPNRKSEIRIDCGVTEAKPGTPFEMSVVSSPHSLVSVLAMDSALLSMAKGNDITESDILNVLKRNENNWDFGEWHLYQGLPSLPCLLILENCTQMSVRLNDFPRLRGGGCLMPDPRPQVRKHFPETWLFELINSDSNGVAKVISTIPDTITKWTVTAFSLDSKLGLTITPKPCSVTVFKPFFVNLNLPISAKRGETIQIQAIVFNYLDKFKGVQVTLKTKMKDDLSLYTEKVQMNHLIIGKQENSCTEFWFKCDQIGQMELIVTATCDEHSDQIIKSLSVKPEGEAQHLSESHFVCLNESEKLKRLNFSKLSFPSIAVPGSRRIEITVNGDILVKSLVNLDRLVRLPDGCGEQNMVNFVPNCLIFNYLRQLNKLEPRMRSKIENNARLGYQRELTYQRNDGSFSVFGQHDRNGSTWLTAFVLRSFALAKDICDIDVKVLKRAYEWIIQKRCPDGGFVEVGFVYDKEMMGGINDSNDKSNKKSFNPSLTAYVIIALYELKKSGLFTMGESLDVLVQDLKQVLESDVNCHTLALVTYALHLVDCPFKDKVWKRLWVRRQEIDNLIFWSNKKSSIINCPGDMIKMKKLDENSLVPSSATLEITAYAVLTMVLRYDQPVACYQAASYLIANQNSFGGFTATQDTVVGLQALCAFATRLPLELNDRNLVLRVLNQKQQLIHSFDVNCTNRMDLQSLAHSEYQDMSSIDPKQINRWLAVLNADVGHASSIVTIEAEGIGTATVQMNLSYNLLEEQKECAFQVKVQKTKNDRNGRLVLTLSVTFVKPNKPSSNMVIVELELPTGFVADQEALNTYQTKNSELIKRIDLQNDNTTIVYYFDQLDRNQPQEVQAFAYRLTDVKGSKESTIKAYDYYERQDYARIFYKI